MAINKKLIHFNEKSEFEKRLANGEILDTSIVFIKDSKEIWTHGNYYASTPILRSSGTSSVLQEVEVGSFVDENPDAPTSGQEIPTEASGNYSVVLNGKSNASAKRSLAHGNRTIAQGENSHTEGHCTQTLYIDDVTNGYAAHAEGYASMAGGTYSHAEGNRTKTAAPNSHAEGYLSITTPEAEASHAEGYETNTGAPASHTEGNNTKTHKAYSHAEGRQTETFGEASHTEGNETFTEGDYSHSEGIKTLAQGEGSHAEGSGTTASGEASHAEGNSTTASGDYSHAEGNNTTASRDYSHAEGWGTIARSVGSHAEGNQTKALDEYSHAEGSHTLANGKAAHAEGTETLAIGKYSHSEGYITLAHGEMSHAEGNNTESRGLASHTEGYKTKAYGEYSHAEGLGTKTKEDIIGQHVEGYYNAESDSVKIIGCGTSDEDRKNAVEVTQDGRVFIKDIGNFNGVSKEASDLKTVLEHKANSGDVYNKTEMDNRIKADLVQKVEVATINGQSLINGGNINVLTGVPIATVDVLGGIKPIRTITGAVNMPSASLTTNSGIALTVPTTTNINSTSSPKNYPVIVDANGVPFVNVAWTDTNVSATATTTTTFYVCGSSSSATMTGTLYKGAGVKVESGTKLYASGGFFQSSDKTLKDIHGNIEVDLEKLSKLNKIYFNFKNNKDTTHVGVIAQEVQELYPEIVSTDVETGKLAVEYDKLSVIALAAIDNLHEENKKLKNKTNDLEERLAKLESLFENQLNKSN